MQRDSDAMWNTYPPPPNGRIFSESCVTINDGKPFHTRCIYCGKLGTLSKTLKRCTRCKAAPYCGRDCQKADYKEHKIWCIRIFETQKAVEQEVEKLHKSDESLSNVHDLFQQDLRFSPHLDADLYGELYDVSPKVFNYYHIRVRLSGALLRESYNRIDRGGCLNEVALEMALEHNLDLMMASDEDTAGVSQSVGSYMITLGKYQQAYDFLKFSMHSWLRYQQVVVRPAFLRMRGENMFEPLEAANLAPEFAELHSCLGMALLKLYLFSAVRSSQLFAQVFDQNQDIATVIGSFLNAPATDWKEVNAASLLVQAQQLLSCVHLLNAHILPGLLNPGPLLEIDLYAADPSSPDFHGSTYEASLTLKKILPWWTQNKIAMNFASNFARGLPSSMKPLEFVR